MFLKNSSFRVFVVGFVLFLSSASFADQYEDLKVYASQVPHAELNQAILGYIANEINEPTDGMKSHYTLGLFEDTQSGQSWYILDGYYELKSGKILFLDFRYDPISKSSWPIKNYGYYMPGMNGRFMLEANEICNPYKRHFIGLVATQLGSVSFDHVQKFFDEKYGRQPIFTINDGDVLIMDPTKSSRMSKSVIFTLHENDLITKLSQATGLSANVLSSGREASTAKLKKTYVGSSGNCK